MKSISSNFRWSFSKLSAFETCPYSFLLQYLQDPPLPQDNNAFAEFGTLCHELLEQYAKGELAAKDLCAEYEKRYSSSVVHSFPPTRGGDYGLKTYQQGIDYFSSFTGFGDQYEIVSTEDKFTLDIAGNQFVGISDLILREKDTGKMIVIDHKTKSESSMKNEIATYRKQLYIYAEHVHQKYGRYPDELRFNMIKPRTWIIEPFSIEKHNETLQWVEEMIDMISIETEYLEQPNYYFCRYICSMLQHCDEGQRFCRCIKKK